MDYKDRITELNFDTDNEEAQQEAVLLRKKLLRRAGTFLGISITVILLSLIAFILLAVFTVRGFEEGILYSIIPLVVGLLAVAILLAGSYYRGLAKDIIINGEKENG